MKPLLYLVVLAAALAAPPLVTPALAHHTFAMFDHDKRVSVNGTVKEFEWTNPHSWMHLVVPGNDGKAEEYSFEMGSTGTLTHDGWKADTVKPGDKISVLMHPYKDGTLGGQEITVTLAGGHVMTHTAAPSLDLPEN